MRIYTMLMMIMLVFVLVSTSAVYALHEETEPAQIEEGIVQPDFDELEIDDEVYAFRATNLIGSTVQNPDGEDLGHIEELVIDLEDGRIAFAVLSFGGFLGFGADLYVIPWELLIPRPIEGMFLLNIDLVTIEEAPGFSADDWPAIEEREWGAGIYEFYGYPPHGTPRAGYWWGTRWQTGGWEMDSPYGRLFNPMTLDTFEAEVIRVERFVPRTEMIDGVQLIVDLDGEPVPVHLGPTWYLEYQDFDIHEGDRVTVAGSRVELNGLPVIIATEIETKDWKLSLRDEDGVPVWSAVRPFEEPLENHNLVEIREFMFLPDTIEVSEGTTVTWINHDRALHTVTSGITSADEVGVLFDSQELQPGQDFTHTFDEVGEYFYFCRFHPNMTGRVMVTE